MDYIVNLLLVATAIPAVQSLDLSFNLTWVNLFEVALFAIWLVLVVHSCWSLYETNREARRSVLLRSLEVKTDANDIVINGEPLKIESGKKLKVNKK